MSEVWIPIPGYEGRYSISTLGRVRSHIGSGRILKAYEVGRGRSRSASQARLAVSLVDANGVVTKHKVHRLVACTFFGDWSRFGLEVCHKNGDSTDNSFENLKWGTHADNMLDRRRHGTDHEVNKTHCPSGHEYADWNLAKSCLPHRRCRACKNAESQVRRNPERDRVEIGNRLYEKYMSGAA